MCVCVCVCSQWCAAFVSHRVSAPVAMKFKGSTLTDLSFGCGLITHEKAALSACGGQVSTFYPSCCWSSLPMSDVRQNLCSHMRSEGPGVCLLPRWARATERLWTMRRLRLIIRNLQQTQIRTLGNAKEHQDGFFHTVHWGGLVLLVKTVTTGYI